MILVLFPSTDEPPVEMHNPRAVTVTADQILIEDITGGLHAIRCRDIAEITIDLARDHGSQDPFLPEQLHGR